MKFDPKRLAESLDPENLKPLINEGANEMKFRCSIYVDIWVPMENLSNGDISSVEAARAIAIEKAEEYSNSIPNSFVGGAGYFNGLNLDKEI